VSAISDLCARVAADLRDAGHLQWTTDELEAHLRRALREYSRARPRRLADVLATVAGVRSYSLASLDGLLAVLDVVHPYDITAPPHPARRPAWRMPTDDTLELLTTDAPRGDGTDDILVRYAGEHSIQGLDGAEATTLDAQGVELVVLGATGYAGEQAALSLVGAVTVGDASARYAAWAAERLRRFRRALEELSAVTGVGSDPRVTWDEEV